MSYSDWMYIIIGAATKLAFPFVLICMGLIIFNWWLWKK